MMMQTTEFDFENDTLIYGDRVRPVDSLNVAELSHALDAIEADPDGDEPFVVLVEVFGEPRTTRLYVQNWARVIFATTGRLFSVTS